MSWTEEKLAEFRRLRMEGHSFSVIADMLGVSRNAVIGKAWRLGERGHKNRPHLSYPPGPKGNRTNGERLGASRVRVERKPQKGKTKPSPPKLHLVYSAPDVRAPQGHEVRFNLRKMHKECSHIAGDPRAPNLMCCGAPIPEGARLEFCDFHLRMAFAPDTRKPKRDVVREEAA